MRGAPALCALLLGALCAGFATAVAPSPLTAWGSAPCLAGAVDAQVRADRLGPPWRPAAAAAAAHLRRLPDLCICPCPLRTDHRC